MFGLGQPLADGLKFIFKEDYRPKDVDKILFTLAPAMMIATIIVSDRRHPVGRDQAVDRQSVSLGTQRDRAVQAAAV